MPAPMGRSTGPSIATPVPSRKKTSCSNGWVCFAVHPPGATSKSRITKFGAPSFGPISTRIVASFTPGVVTRSDGIAMYGRILSGCVCVIGLLLSVLIDLPRKNIVIRNRLEIYANSTRKRDLRCESPQHKRPIPGETPSMSHVHPDRDRFIPLPHRFCVQSRLRPTDVSKVSCVPCGWSIERVYFSIVIVSTDGLKWLIW